jgi:hypothetical protein
MAHCCACERPEPLAESDPRREDRGEVRYCLDQASGGFRLWPSLALHPSNYSRSSRQVATHFIHPRALTPGQRPNRCRAARSSRHASAAARGAWVEFDGISEESVDKYVTLVLQMQAAGLERVLVSHDAGWCHVGEPDGGKFRPFDTLFTMITAPSE